MRGLWHDVTYGLRGLVRNPGFSVAALAALTLGIGSNTAIFTVLDGVFLRPLHLAGIERLAGVYRTLRDGAGEYVGESSLSHPNYLDYRARNHSFEELAQGQWWPMNLTGGSEPQRVTGMYVTGNYFDVLGLEADRGRLLRDDDDSETSAPVAVLSHGAWRRIYGAEAQAVGRTLAINGEPLTIVGVAPRGFHGTVMGIAVDVFVPLHSFRRLSPYGAYFDDRGVSLFPGIGRLREGVGVEQASDELMALARQLAAEYPETLDELGAKALPLAQSAIAAGNRGRYRRYGARLLVVVLILLIACLSVANLLFVRGVKRARELAVRQALGAGRGRLVRQLLTENLLLFILGGLGSLLVAKVFLKLLWSYRPPEMAQDALRLAVDARVWSFALATAVAVGLIFGLWPALRAARVDLTSNLKETEPLAARRSVPFLFKPRSLVVALQIALALVAMIGAGLLLSNLRRVLEVDLGFASDRLAVLTVSPGEQGYEQAQLRSYYQRLLDRARALPGVAAAALSQNRLLRGSTIQREVYLPGDDKPRQIGARTHHRINAVGPGFFAAVGIPLRSGRDFRDAEPEEPALAIVNETMAERLWPGRDPIGQRFHFDYPTTPPLEVVGVVADAKYRHIREDEQFFIYRPLAQDLVASVTLHVRTAGDPAALLEPLARAVRALDPSLVQVDVGTMRSFVEEAQWSERSSTSLLALFGALALALALLGIYGLLAYTVEQRQRELGILVALGARGGDVVKTVLGEALQVAAAGIVVGLASAYFLLEPLMANQLEGVSVLEPGICLLWSSVLLLAALAGSLLPAWRATRTNPIEALRAE